MTAVYIGSAQIYVCQVFLMRACFIGLAVLALFALVRATLPTVSGQLRREIRRTGRIAGLTLLLPLAFVCGMIVYGSTKNNSQTNAPAPQMMGLSPARTASAPSGLVEKWFRRGAWEDGIALDFGGGWCFPCGSNHLTHIEVWSQGRVYPSEKSVTPIAALSAPLALKPMETRVTIGRTMNNSYRIEWLDAHPNRANDQRVDAAIELFRNGNVAVTEGGVTAVTPYDPPFAHVGFGQDDEWVWANFSNAEEILAVGYANWVNDQVGIGLENGLYKFTATYWDDPPEPSQLVVGDLSVAVTNAGEYVFLLRKGPEYAFNASPCGESVEYAIQDDVGWCAMPLLSGWWDGDVSTGVWSVDGGDSWLSSPIGSLSGLCRWLPTLQGSPDVSHIGPEDVPLTFEALLTDYCEDLPVTYSWTASDDNIRFSSSDSRTTEARCVSFPSWEAFGMTVEADLGGYSLWSTLYASVGRNVTPQTYLSIHLPEGLVNCGERRELTASFGCDVETNGYVVICCTSGDDKIELWSDLTNGVSMGTSASWYVSDSNSFSCYVQGVGISDYREVEFECTYVPDVGDGDSVSTKTTVFECYAQPISDVCHTWLEVINPSFLDPSSNAVFRVDVSPTSIPASKIVWNTVSGSATFPAGNVGREVKVLGVCGMVDLRISVLGATDERMHFKSEVLQ